jgi:hypothetical protein
MEEFGTSEFGSVTNSDISLNIILGVSFSELPFYKAKFQNDKITIVADHLLAISRAQVLIISLTLARILMIFLTILSILAKFSNRL